jgi:hypothetical protein
MKSAVVSRAFRHRLPVLSLMHLFRLHIGFPLPKQRFRYHGQFQVASLDRDRAMEAVRHDVLNEIAF